MYYACFYCATAYLAVLEEDVSTHKTVKAKFNLLMVRENLVSKPAGRAYNRLFILRHEVNYRDFSEVGEEKLGPLREQIGELLVSVEKLVAAF